MKQLLNIPPEQFTVGAYVETIQQAKNDSMGGLKGAMPWIKNSPEAKAVEQELAFFSSFTQKELDADSLRPFDRRRKVRPATLFCPP